MVVAGRANNGKVVCNDLIGLAGRKSFYPGLLERVIGDSLVELAVASVRAIQRGERN